MDGAWGRRKSLGCRNQKTRLRDGLSGCSSGETFSQESVVPRENSTPSTWRWLNPVIRQCHEAPASEGSVVTTDNQPACNLRAALVRWRKFFHL